MLQFDSKLNEITPVTRHIRKGSSDVCNRKHRPTSRNAAAAAEQAGLMMTHTQFSTQ